MDMSEIDHGVYQGGQVDTRPPGIDVIVDLQGEKEDMLSRAGLEMFIWCPIDDGPPFPGVVWLDTVVNCISTCRKAGWFVLIHCAAGIRRSGMVDVAYHMKMNRIGWEAALALVKSKRPQTNPNPWFMSGLLEYEKFLQLGKG